MKIMFDLFCFLYFILYNLAGNHHIIIIFSCISRLQLFYSHDWRDHLLTKTGTSNRKVFYLLLRFTLCCLLLHVLLEYNDQIKCGSMTYFCWSRQLEMTMLGMCCEAFRVLLRSLTWSVQRRWSCLWCAIRATSA